MATVVTKTEEEPTCPICLGLFNVPRQLPCAHTFCQSCLQSYITSKATEHGKKGYIECPVCRKTTSNFKQNKPMSEWASFFPADTVIQSLLPSKSRVNRVCDACNSDGISVTATGFCAVCEEAMCDDCLNVHRKQKMTKTHTILTIEELLNNPQNVMKFAEGFSCFDHDGEDLKFYCKNHKHACCGICFLESHKTCSDVRKLKEELPTLLLETNLSEITEELKKLETHLEMFINVKESNINDLESQVNGLGDQIREMRKKINTALDELEMKMKMEGRRIHKEVAIRTQEENHQCLSLLHAIKNSQGLCETVDKYGIDIQKFLTAEKIKLQLPLYCSQVREKYEKTDTLTVQMKFTPLLQSILSLSSTDIGKLVTMTSSTFSIPGLRKPTKECQVDKVETFNINISGGTLCYTGVSILPGDRVMLVDNTNSQCILLNNSHEVVTNYKLAGNPCDICVVGENEVAVTMFSQNKIQILSVRDDVISPVRTITTRHKCYGITAAGKGEMVVIGDCDNKKYCWSLIRDGREVDYSDQYDSTSGWNRYIALNKSKTRVYITVNSTNSVHCCNMEGKKLYTYSPDNLKCPLGVAVDGDDNIYIVGYHSHNIHQLSPEGCVLQVITTGVPQYPRAISFDNTGDAFIITNDSDSKTIHIYQMK
ncbi:hypothetical protein CHS0354_004923 [Potamilus streckersoni]|uniref:Uncharacterized protein n=1 Tax=Potamilus streckersoni TaxID=2493646 RepID=A0AAE0TJ28_9BIVA|nr:hypothetical protein CHS0354_004923 [Potamilus streckersoni]